MRRSLPMLGLIKKVDHEWDIGSGCCTFLSRGQGSLCACSGFGAGWIDEDGRDRLPCWVRRSADQRFVQRRVGKA